MKDISWVAVVAAAVLLLAGCAAAYGLGAEDWYAIASGGVVALIGIGLVLMSWREER